MFSQFSCFFLGTQIREGCDVLFNIVLSHSPPPHPAKYKRLILLWMNVTDWLDQPVITIMLLKLKLSEIILLSFALSLLFLIATNLVRVILVVEMFYCWNILWRKCYSFILQIYKFVYITSKWMTISSGHTTLFWFFVSIVNLNFSWSPRRFSKGGQNICDRKTLIYKGGTNKTKV